MEAYYSAKGITLYHGRYEKILSSLRFDAIVTDPPYPGHFEAEYKYYDGILKPLAAIECPQAIFWTPSAVFPLDWQGLHVWDKATGSNTQFELIYFRGKRSGYKVHRFMSPHNPLRAKICGDMWTPHPSQKPVQLMQQLVDVMRDARVVCDPFSGSGSTLVACKAMGKKAIGIEMNKLHCDLIIERLEECA
ncbi:site-specific DNA-methyltransferase [Cyanobium sp. ATX 6E8]|uniref:DNA methyltransferase n=1 Tax=Cyanobium sp. ATX 6E8 TaxID=2823701 RepID=UPI0020CC35D3|nr:DNA methyltransferase [Cyanobium sp. ATX 6E8]MCP9943031.1 site-specific DNA-methyltransferase [Cyanobium sp. ATX 6E8]